MIERDMAPNAEPSNNTSDYVTAARAAKVTDRKESYYRRVFTFEDSDLVLDLGAGKSPFRPDNFVRYDYSYARHAPETGRNVAGLFQDLPFRSETFDSAVASWSLVYVQNDKSKAIAEALRVIKPGGTLQVAPAGRLHGPERSEFEAYCTYNNIELRRPKLDWLTKFCGVYTVGLETAAIAQAASGGSIGQAALTGFIGLCAAGAGALSKHQFAPQAIVIPRTEEHSDPNYRAAFCEELLQICDLTLEFRAEKQRP